MHDDDSGSKSVSRGAVQVGSDAALEIASSPRAFTNAVFSSLRSRFKTIVSVLPSIQS